MIPLLEAGGHRGGGTALVGGEAEVNWSDGLVFEQVCADLEAQGYEVQPFILPACGVDAPHRRDRVWFIAHRTDTGVEAMQQRGQDSVCGLGAAPYSECIRRNKVKVYDGELKKLQQAECQQIKSCGADSTHNRWRHFPTQSHICSRNDGLSYRLDGITFPKWRAESIKAYGNAIVPQVALRIFNTINQITK